MMKMKLDGNRPEWNERLENEPQIEHEATEIGNEIQRSNHHSWTTKTKCKLIEL